MTENNEEENVRLIAWALNKKGRAMASRPFSARGARSFEAPREPATGR